MTISPTATRTTAGTRSDAPEQAPLRDIDVVLHLDDGSSCMLPARAAHPLRAVATVLRTAEGRLGPDRLTGITSITFRRRGV